MDLMKDINQRADEYTPPEEEVVEEGMQNMMLKAMDAERAKKIQAKQAADDQKKKDASKKQKHTKEYIKMMQGEFPMGSR